MNATTDYTPTSEHLPENGKIVEAVDKGGYVHELKRENGLWWVADGSMYVYFVPVMWRYKH